MTSQSQKSNPVGASLALGVCGLVLLSVVVLLQQRRSTSGGPAAVLAAELEPASPQEGFVFARLSPGPDQRDAALEIHASRPIPTDEFTPGHTSARTAEDVKVTRTASGFSIQMPSRTPVPTPSVYRGRLYVGGGFSSREFYCFDAHTGELQWAVDLSDDGPSWAVAAQDSIIFNTESCTLFALDAATGKHLWSHYLGDPLLSSPTVADGRVFTVYPVTAVYPGAPQMAPGDAPQDEPAVDPAEQHEERLPASPTHILACFDLKTGKVLWQRWVDTDCISAPIAAGRELYVATFSGTVYRFDQADGSVLSARQLRATSAPVIAGSDVYLTGRGDDGRSGPVEALLVQNPTLDAEQNLVATMAAPYLDRRIQEQAESAQEAAAFEVQNGIMGGFGGGQFFMEDPESADQQPLQQARPIRISARPGFRFTRPAGLHPAEGGGRHWSG